MFIQGATFIPDSRVTVTDAPPDEYDGLHVFRRLFMGATVYVTLPRADMTASTYLLAVLVSLTYLPAVLDNLSGLPVLRNSPADLNITGKCFWSILLFNIVLIVNSSFILVRRFTESVKKLTFV